MDKSTLRPCRNAITERDGGLFHEFGLFKGQTAAIVEWPDGTVDMMPVDALQFTKVTTDFGSSVIVPKNAQIVAHTDFFGQVLVVMDKHTDKVTGVLLTEDVQKVLVAYLGAAGTD